MSETTTELFNPTMKTGTVARICRVSLATVSHWIDSSALKGRKMPSRFRVRVVDWQDLVRFFADNDMPDSWLEEFEREYA